MPTAAILDRPGPRRRPRLTASQSNWRWSRPASSRPQLPARPHAAGRPPAPAWPRPLPQCGDDTPWTGRRDYSEAAPGWPGRTADGIRGRSTGSAAGVAIRACGRRACNTTHWAAGRPDRTPSTQSVPPEPVQYARRDSLRESIFDFPQRYQDTAPATCRRTDLWGVYQCW